MENVSSRQVTTMNRFNVTNYSSNDAKLASHTSIIVLIMQTM